MTGIILHTMPRRRTVTLEQIRTVGLFTRSGALLLVGSFAVIAIMVINAAARDHFTVFDYDPRESGLFSAIAFVYPFLIWQGEDPWHRAYHWMMPVDRRGHALSKVFAGWVWLVAAMVLTLVGIVVIGTIASSVAGKPLAERSFGWWGWLVPFTSITIAYCLASAAVVGTRQPLVRVVGVVAAFSAITGGLRWLGHPAAAQKVLELQTGRYGLTSALFGPIYTAETPSLERWLVASAIWGSVAVLLLVWMSSRGADRS
jgi:hypothetical protein